MSKYNHNIYTEMLPHTEAKLKLYEKYLNRYLFILSNYRYCEKINIYDIFCGPGIYKNNIKGSPIIAFDCINNIIESSKINKKYSLTINDKRKEYIDNIKEFLNNQEFNKSIFNIRTFNKDAEEMLNIVIKEINNSNKQKNLIFIDPTGYKQITKEYIKRLLENKNSEIILFLPINHMYRFKDDAIDDYDNPSYKALRKFLYSFFDDEHPIIKKDKNIDRFKFINYIKEAFSFSSKYFTGSYYIQRNKSDYYAIFFITSNLLGLEKFNECKWSENETTGEGFSNKEFGFFEEYFNNLEKKEKLKELKNIIIDLLKNNISFSNNDLYFYIINYGFKPNHANVVLKEMLKKNEIKIEKYNNIKIKSGAFYLKYDYFKKKDIKIFISLSK